MKGKGPKSLSPDEIVKKHQQFLVNFEDYDMPDLGELYERYGRKKYMIEMQKLANNQINAIEILFEDLESFFRKEDEKELMKNFGGNTHRSIRIFSDLIHKLLPPRNRPIPSSEQLKEKFENLLNNQRRLNLNTSNEAQRTQNETIPSPVLHNIEVFIIFGPSSKIHLETISELTSDKIGSLVACKAIVVRASEIKPELKIATYACDMCGCENYQMVGDREYRPMIQCMSKRCKQNKISGKLTFLPGHSTFQKYQELKVQETPDQLNPGSIPKTFSIHLKGSNCKKAAPGDIIIVQGILLPIKKEGRRPDHGLTFGSYIEGYKILREKKKYVELAITQEQQLQIHALREKLSDQNLFIKLAKSIAPQIYGMEAVKKALLLLLVGGVTKKTHDNLRIRGEINIALIGDPGIAKSQLLKHIAYISPRGVYTTGKGSSGVGLTAAIVVDPQTRQISLEAGALVLADMGVCCIDEFDKMGEHDRTAIHEVMEQQTVSIAKAGITTTLNARSSILAAANPLYGRYNRKETPHKNINLPAALLSRFDLIFILLDLADSSRDMELALHIGRVHKNLRSPQQEELFDSNFVRTYVALSKNFNPVLSPELHEEMINLYVERRKDQMDISKEGTNYTTMRSLLALIRLCQARAKLRFSNEVTRSDLLDCLQIIEESQKFHQESNTSQKKLQNDASSTIFNIIKSMCSGKSNSKGVSVEAIKKRILARGFSQEQLEKTLKEYEDLNIIMISSGEINLIN